jgi:hypothetical protein
MGLAGRRTGTLVALCVLTATQVSAQETSGKSGDPPPKQSDAEKKKGNKAQDAQAKNPADAKNPDVAKQGDVKGPDTPLEADNHPPSVTPSAPSITDTATLSAPGWIEADLTAFKDLNRDRIFGTPSLLKLTSTNRRLQYRLATDGYIQQGDSRDGVGDTYFALQYLYKPQEKAGFDLAGRVTAKIPTGNRNLGGTQKFDFSGLLLASRDFTKWQFHGDFNVGFSSLTRADAGGADYQFLAAASTTTPIKGGRWQYSNELVYFSPIQGQRYRVTTMHGFAFAQHRYEVYNASVQWQLHGDGATFQVLFSGSFFLGKLF